MKKLVIFGNGTLAALADEYFRHDSDYCVVGHVVDDEYITEDLEEIVPFSQMPIAYPPDEYYAFVAIGYSNMNLNRKKKIDEIEKKGYRLASYISSHCYYWQFAKIGKNSMLMEKVVVQPFVTVGNNCIVCSGSIISHNSVVSDNVYIACGAMLAGNVSVGEYSFIGAGAVVKDNVTISPYSLIGAGTYIASDTESYGVYGERGTRNILAKVDSSIIRDLQINYI